MIWFGALGAVLLSLTGVFDHVSDWDDGYVLWHIARPLVGAAVAVVAVLIVIAGILAAGSNPPNPTSTPNKTTDIFYFLVAFLVGYREETFRLLVKRLADVVLAPGETPPPAPLASAPAITAVTPASGKADDAVTISGSGLGNTSAVTFGTAAAKRIQNVSDASLTAIVPPGEPGSEVVLVISTPGGSIAGPKFRYLPSGE